MDSEQLDREFKREELKRKLMKPLIFVGIIALGMLLLFSVTSKPVEQEIEVLNGRTLIVIPVSESYGYDSAMIVLLDDGSEAPVPIKKGIVFEEDRAIEINKLTSEGGSVSYEFSRYLEE